VKEVLIYDTEFTAWTGSMARNWRGPGEFKEIVQIGAITLAAQDMNETGSFSVLIRPVKNPVLSSYFEKLTRINNQQLESSGLSFARGSPSLQGSGTATSTRAFSFRIFPGARMF
jgi:inhibitor of KinA sporulation pathway (predicted exonuclease)